MIPSNPPWWAPLAEWRAVVSRLRCQFTPNRVIHAHHGDRVAEMHYRMGITWRRVDGIRWCPFCGSVHPLDLLRRIHGRTRWSPIEAQAEMRALIERGEMESSHENFMRTMTPLEDQVYSVYRWNQAGFPADMLFVTQDLGQVKLSLDHLADLSVPDRALAAAEMNAWNPGLHISSDLEGNMLFSHTGIAIISSSSGEDDEEDDPPDDGDQGS